MAKRGRPIKVINDIEARLLWARGESPRKIARHFGVAKNTIVNHLRRLGLMAPAKTAALEPANIPVLPESVVPVSPSPVTAPKGPWAPDLTTEPKLEPPSVMGAPTQITPPPLIETDCNMGAITPDTKQFFLTDNNADAAVAWHLAQPALALQNGWHEDYSTLPAFQNAERIYLASSTGDHADTLVAALATSSIAEKVCVITEPIRDACETRRWLQRIREDSIFETVLMISRPPAFFAIADYVRRYRSPKPTPPESDRDRLRREHPALFVNENKPPDWKPWTQ